MMALPSEHRAVLRQVYRSAYPRECCGVLLGIQTASGDSVRLVLPTLNAVSLPGGFAIPDAEIRRARHIASRHGLSILAVYHSHPSGLPDLSTTDRAALAHSEWPWVVLTEDIAEQELLLTWWKAPGPTRFPSAAAR